MKKIALALIAFFLFSSHIMYLKLDTYFLKPNTSATIQLFNGTFDKSENVITRDRMIDVSIVENGKRTKVNDSQWSERDSITFLNFRTGAPGTYVAGVSTRPNSLAMDAEAFNTYLDHEGIKDMLAWRQENNAMDSAAVEKYSKHVKAIFQVGDTKTDDWQAVLEYPIEFVPLDNPYQLHTGDALKFKLLVNGQPLPNQLVYADYKPTVETPSKDNEEVKHSHTKNPEDGHSHEATTAEHSHDGDESHTHSSGQELRTDSQGMATAQLTADGIWYLQTIHLVTSEEEGMTHESNWSTLTFEVTHAHGEDTHTHGSDTHTHEEGGIPSYAYWIGSVLLVAVLFFWFNSKK